MDILYKLYFSIPGLSRYGRLGVYFDQLLKRLLILIFNAFVPNRLLTEKYELNKEFREKKVVFSLTTFPARIDTIWIVIRSLFRQTYKPDKIILWLAESQFPNKEFELPKSLTDLCVYGLEIRWCEDLRSHKKYYFVMQECPDDILITFDDDFFYPNNVASVLMNLSVNNPSAICASRAHLMIFDNCGKLKPYLRWKFNYLGGESDSLFFTTGAIGTLFPPKSLHEDVFDKYVFMEICKFADDVWLNIMARRAGTKIVRDASFNKPGIMIKSSQKNSLCHVNVASGGNDLQIKNVCDHFSFYFKP